MTRCWTWAKCSACGSSKALPGWRTSSFKAGVNVMVIPTWPLRSAGPGKLRTAHTPALLLGAYLAGFDIVPDCMHNDAVRTFEQDVHEEVIPSLPWTEGSGGFASAVQDRFNNPFIDQCSADGSSLNSTSKWKARNMPSFLSYIEERSELPACLIMSLAAYIAFYSNDIRRAWPDCKRLAGNTYKIHLGTVNSTTLHRTTPPPS